MRWLVQSDPGCRNALATVDAGNGAVLSTAIMQCFVVTGGPSEWSDALLAVNQPPEEPYDCVLSSRCDCCTGELLLSLQTSSSRDLPARQRLSLNDTNSMSCGVKKS